MLIPTYVQLRYWFYPIGNTPAVNLLRDRPPSEGSVTTILCLACGDVRNILFTLSTEPPSAHHSYELAFCDYEPAVLARNIFLFTFLAAGPSKDNNGSSELDHLWELYYHTFICSSAKNALARHVKHLVEASRSSHEWNESNYGKAINFHSESTLQEIRHYWQLYLDACHNDHNDRESEVKGAVQEIVKQYGLDDGRLFHGSTRATGVHALGSAPVMSAAFRAYWTTGVVAGNVKDCSTLERDHGGHANPLLYISSAPLSQFAVHYGTDPLHGFHLAEVFDTPGEEKETLQRLASTAKSQFREWCASFREHIRMGGLRMLFHCGEALSFCYELQRRGGGEVIVPVHLNTYSRPWSGSCLDLSLGKRLNASSYFNIIDTSNISDYVGILNLLPAVRPLLNDSVLSVLYTETLLRAAEESTGYLDELLRLDVGSFGLIAGIAPTASLLGITNEHFGSEVFLGHYGRDTGSQSQMRVRISWKKPSGGDQLAAPLVTPTTSANAEDLASLLFRWYLNMFSAFENISARLSAQLRSTLNPLSHDRGLYTRATLIALIGLTRKHVQTDWSRCIELLLDKIQDDKTLFIGSNSLQELFMLLHTARIYEVSALNMPPKAAATNFSVIADSYVRHSVNKWPDMPSVVATALIVPRDKLHVLTSADLDRIGTPGLHIAVYNEGIFENKFHAIHACFGKLVIADDGKTSTIDENALGWRGHSDLIITCLVPAFQFLAGRPGETRAALVVNTSAANAYFTPILGLHLRLFATPIDNRQNFHILPTLPGVRPSEQAPVLHTPHGSRSAEPAVSISPRDERLELLTSRQHYASKSEREYLQSGSDVRSIQESPCTMDVQLGNHCRRLQFPFPVDGSRVRIRVARKQFWVEIVVPISLATHLNGYALRPFPVVSEMGQFVGWGMGRINLAKSPIMADGSLKTLNTFLAMTLSVREQNAQSNPSEGTELVRSLVEMKESLAALFTNFASKDNSSGRKRQAFNLAVEKDSDILIFANSFRHDKDSGSMCLDAHVVPLTPQRIQKLSQALANTVRGQNFMGINVSKQEEILWKHVLPAFVERCRHSWQHKPTCEYIQPDLKCPRSVLHGEPAICSCGEGKDITSLPREFSAFSRFATRIAIAPLSAVPMVEPMVLDSILSSRGDLRPTIPHESQVTPPVMQKDRCGSCGSTASGLKACARCGLVKYCNKNCQTLAWKTHKPECRRKNAQVGDNSK